MPESLTLGQVVSLIEQMEYRQRALDAVCLDLMCAAVEMATGGPRAAENDLSYRSLRAELATTLGTSERVAETQMDAAWSLRRDYAATHETLAGGEISAAHARVIVDAGRRIGTGSAPDVTARRAAYESEVLLHARRESVNRLRPIARRIAEQFAVESLDERHLEEVRRRHVIVKDREDGMSDLHAYLPTVEAYAIHDRLTRIAREVERAELRIRDEQAAACGGGDLRVAEAPDSVQPEHRTRDEIRADVFSELLLASDATELASCTAPEAMRARVQVIVPVEAMDAVRQNSCSATKTVESPPVANGKALARTEALAGTEVPTGTEALSGTEVPTGTEEPADALSLPAVAELVGAGPIALVAARAIAAATHVWERVTVSPDSGAVIAVDRYRPSEEMRRRLAARDQHCRFPGCRIPVSRCDLDHTVDAALGGPTSTANLAHLCRGHHVLKHNSHWRVRQRIDGELLWTSPSGRNHVDRPPSRVRFAKSAPEVRTVLALGRDRGGGGSVNTPTIGAGRDANRTCTEVDDLQHPF
ncbi:DUF222 domain-containing protein [Leucobacter sp. NPDC077196]|uniref:HNH endonuclease signature motif containing protein n=1 Tax=Leucobacter sp. NPDC077196 TaxID=3154959 RepID=UPI0034418328